MGINKRLINTGGGATPAPFDPLANFETVLYTGNGGTQKINGYIRKGAAFNGSGSSISTNYIVPAISTQSISVWFNTSTSSGYRTLFSDAPSNGAAVNVRMQLYTTPSSTFEIVIGNNQAHWVGQSNSISSYLDGDWHNIVVTYSGTSVKSYIDGSLFQSFTSSVSFGTAGNQSLVFGKAGLNNVNYWSGKMDQIRVFDAELTSSNVSTLYAETYASATKSTTDIFGNGSGISLYQLEDNSNDTGIAIDSGQSGVFTRSPYISIPTMGVFLDKNTSSISMWIKTSGANSPLEFFFADYAGSSFNHSLSIYPDKTIRRQTRYSGTDSAELSSSAVSLNEWHHVVSVVNVSNNTQQLYVDGSLAATGSIPTGSWSSLGNTEKVIIGGLWGSNQSNNLPFGGGIDQVRVYSSALSAADVTNIYNETNIPTSNFVSWYKLDGNANDSKASNNGTWSGTEAYSTAARRTHNGTNTAINYLGMAFKPGLVWTKLRSSTNRHQLFDSVRGVTKAIESDTIFIESTESTALTSFDSNGFTLGASGNVNTNDAAYVAWCWKTAASTTTISANTVGNTIASDVRANVASGFSVVKYTGTGNDGMRVAHGLDTPKLVLLKNLEQEEEWQAFGFASFDRMILNDNDADKENLPMTANSTTFQTPQAGGQGGNAAWNGSGKDYIAYCFKDISDYQKIGSYGGGSTNVISTGFSPRFLMVKRINSSGGWYIFDAARNTSNPRDLTLFANSSAAEAVEGAFYKPSFVTNGFSWPIANGEGVNVSGGTYIYLAIA